MVAQQTQPEMMEMETLGTNSIPTVYLRLSQTNSVTLPSQGLDKDEIEYPDGGVEAYLVVFGSFMGNVTCLGLINSIGAIQAYVSSHQLSDMNVSSISWIFSIYLSLAYALGIISGPIFDRKGARGILIVSTVLIFVGLMGASASTQIYQFILCFISLGFGNGIGLTPVVGVINHWFFRKAGFATGVVTSGGSFGGLVFPLILRHTFNVYGYGWSIRILAFINLGCMLLAIAFSKERILKASPEATDPIITKHNGMWTVNIKLAISKMLALAKKHSDRAFIFTIFGSLCSELCLLLALTYFVNYTVIHGYSESTGFLLLTVWNSTSIVGRILPGMISDYIGKFNVNIVMLTGLTTAMLSIWYAFGSNIKALYAFACIGGFFQGLISALLPACLADITKVSEFGERFGILNFILSFANLVGIPIGASIINNNTVHSYDVFVIFVSCICLAALVLFMCARFAIVGAKFNVKV